MKLILEDDKIKASFEGVEIPFGIANGNGTLPTDAFVQMVAECMRQSEEGHRQLLALGRAIKRAHTTVLMEG